MFRIFNKTKRFDTTFIKNLNFPTNKNFVLHIIEPEPEGSLGGADSHVLELAKYQLKYSSLTPIVLINQNKTFAKMLHMENIPYIDCTGIKNLKLGLVRIIKYLPMMINIKLIHSHQYDSNYIAYMLAIINPNTWGVIPNVMTCHGWVEESFKEKIKTLLDFYTYRIADGLITVCSKDKKRLAKKKYSNITMIHNGVSINHHCNSEKTEELRNLLGLEREKKVVVAVGRLAREKRIDIFIKACAELLKNRNDFQFLIIGDGELRDEFEKLIFELDAVDSIKLTGFRKDIESFYDLADLLVLTSDTEGTPRVVLEAMARKMPIVATKVGGLPDIINCDNGILCDPEEYTQIADGISAILDNEEKYKTMSINARVTIIEKFSILKMQEEVENFYKKIIG